MVYNFREYPLKVYGVHPNDLGFYRMANAVEPKLRMMLKGVKV